MLAFLSIKFVDFLDLQYDFGKIYDFYSEAISHCSGEQYLRWLQNLPSIFEVKIMDIIDPCTYWVHLYDGVCRNKFYVLCLVLRNCALLKFGCIHSVSRSHAFRCMHDCKAMFCETCVHLDKCLPRIQSADSSTVTSYSWFNKFKEE